MLGQLSWEDEAHSSLDLSGGHSWLLVVASQVGGLVGNLVEDIIDEGVHDRHGLGRDTSIWVDLLEDLVDIDLVCLSL
jgi:hypothetical protein